METLYTISIFVVLLGAIAVPYWLKVAKERRTAEEQFQKSQRAGGLLPVTLHPHIDQLECIGCGSCVQACPEDVLGLVHGRAFVINGLRCVGHALCADVCPVGAIELRFGTPKQGQEIPVYNDDFETNVEGIYVVGELGGIGLIRNAVNQAMRAVQHINVSGRRARHPDEYDVIIVGAGPAGLSATLAARAHGLKVLTLEQDSIGGTVYHYPRQKLVLTNPLELPMYGRIEESEITKEDLLSMWRTIVKTFSLPIQVGEKVESVERTAEGFLVRTASALLKSRSVILALGRRGSPRRLGIPGEDQPHVAYKLQEAESYQRKRIIVVGGGDSAIEAAVALARQPGNQVSVSYRREVFVRLKEKNEKNIQDLIRSGKVKAYMKSNVKVIHPSSVELELADGSSSPLENDYVFIFAGGDAPTELPRKAGVRFRSS